MCWCGRDAAEHIMGGDVVTAEQFIEATPTKESDG
jgi:hypothetical protein